jgi:molybdopterin-synthase adenylyltransferase
VNPSARRRSVAMTGAVHDPLVGHLLRGDGQEDVCLALYQPSTGVQRSTALLTDVVFPQAGERLVHGNAAFTTGYVMRAAALAARSGAGLVTLHAHPASRGWQGMSRADHATEAGYANAVREVTGLPLVGLTLAADDSWSARHWDTGQGRQVTANDAENVRVLRGDQLVVSWNNNLRPVPPAQASQLRTVHCWGEQVQANLARLRVLIVGAGSVGFTVAVALAATGIEHLAILDYDTVKPVNRDRLLGATRLDVALARAKTDVCLRLAEDASTAAYPQHEAWADSVCEPAGMAHALDFDIIFSCVDRPWARYVLNTIAYADLIPVVDGGIHVDPHPAGGMRGAMWRSHVVGPGRACLACNGQFEPRHVSVERDGSLDNPSYIDGLPTDHPLRVSQNVSTISVNCAGALLAQFVSLVVRPGGLGDPGPIRYHLAPHWLKHDDVTQCVEGCSYAAEIACGDRRIDPTGRHPDAEAERARRTAARRRPRLRIAGALDDRMHASHLWLGRKLGAC